MRGRKYNTKRGRKKLRGARSEVLHRGADSEAETFTRLYAVDGTAIPSAFFSHAQQQKPRPEFLVACTCWLLVVMLEYFHPQFLALSSAFIR